MRLFHKTEQRQSPLSLSDQHVVMQDCPAIEHGVICEHGEGTGIDPEQMSPIGREAQHGTEQNPDQAFVGNEDVVLLCVERIEEASDPGCSFLAALTSGHPELTVPRDVCIPEFRISFSDFLIRHVFDVTYVDFIQPMVDRREDPLGCAYVSNGLSCPEVPACMDGSDVDRIEVAHQLASLLRTDRRDGLVIEFQCFVMKISVCLVCMAYDIDTHVIPRFP